MASCGGEAPSSTEGALTSAWKPKAKGAHNLRFATFNIRNFPVAQDQVDAGKKPVSYQLETDPKWLGRVLHTLDAEVIAVQEIWDTAALQGVFDTAAQGTKHHYQGVFAQNAWSPQHVGLVVDTSRFQIVWSREHPEVDITKTMRSALSVRLQSVTPGGLDLTVMVLHLASGESASRAALRLQQVKAAAGIIAAEIEELGDDDYLVLGDLNTAKEEEEMPDLDAAFAGVTSLDRRKNDAGCTAYFAPDSKKPALTPAWIDHVYASGMLELDEKVPLLSGTHCAEHRCEPFESKDAASGRSYWNVSDHCPVYFEIGDRDEDAP